jgi:hypothetical protein
VFIANKNRCILFSSEKLGIYQQKQLLTVFNATKATRIDCLLFRRAAKNFGNCGRAAKNFGIANKSTAFCSAVQRKNLNCEQSTVFCSAAQRKFWNRATKTSGIANKTLV